jgi:membrane-associated protease RseP (regulator of RpoE activity)
MVGTMADPNNPEGAIIGVTHVSNYFHNLPAYLTLFWLHFWSLNIAIFNMLPIYPLDGEGIIYNLTERVIGDRKRIIRWAVTAFYITLLALNIGLTFGRFGFISI